MDYSKEIHKRAETLQDEYHEKVLECIGKNSKLKYQDVYNSLLILHLARLELTIEQILESK